MGWLPEQTGNGLDRVYHSLAQALPGVGVDMTGLVAGSAAVSQSSSGQVSAFAPDTSSLPARLLGVRRAARDSLAAGVDVVAAHFALYTLPLLDLLRDTPLVVHFHGPWALESASEGDSRAKTWLKRTLETRVYRRADRCIVLSEAFRTLLHTTHGVPLDRIHMVPGGVDVDRFAVEDSSQAARARLGWPQDRPILLSVRRLARRMGLENLIEAFATVRQTRPDALLYIAGTGPLRPDLEAQIQDQGLSEHVRLLGFVPDNDLPYTYRAADLSVVPTVQLEGFGLITIESLAAGTPVLVTPVGGLPETVSALSERLVLPDASVEALAGGLTAALRSPASLPSPSSCREYARSTFGWPAIARRTRDVYAEAAHAHGPH
jgi:glycosyltransferase involved in cell wall biosynthesis